ncbi:MAG: M48 family metallopeptidase [Deltaproteobacteria bacterium]|nr:M48 family metallopeptidase [Deltaproteobacteria bacterium]
MKSSALVEIKGAGNILFERSRRARRLNITIRPVKGVRVAVPCWMTFEEAHKIVSGRSAWIRKHTLRMEEERLKCKALTKDLPLPERKEAKNKIIKRVEALALEHAFHYNRIIIRNQKTRWGSCSAKNNINLNIKLARLPNELLDYVVLHELVHTRIKNHGSRFWGELDKILGNAKKIDAKMKPYRLDLL